MEVYACRLCGREDINIASVLGFCAGCIRSDFDQIKPEVEKVHKLTRKPFSLAEVAPKAGASCGLCVQDCRIGEGQRGYCGLRINEGGRVVHLGGSKDTGILSWYKDPLPTNCVADWVCEGSSRAGMHNLAVFYESCTFNCLFCQNWHFRRTKPDEARKLTAEQLAEVADQETFCVCFFGGDPSSQMPHALASARRLAEKGVRICWETNGSMSTSFVKRAVELSLHTGGIIKFDLKAWNESIHYALTGATNSRTLENFRYAVELSVGRKSPPPIVASTLLVPGYVDDEEISGIANFLSSLDKHIPYSLLAFHPQFFMTDLPTTSRKHAERAKKIAEEAGLKRVRIGNIHLLSDDDYY